jgi:hypothetical protein
LDPAQPRNNQGRIVADMVVTNTARELFRHWRQDVQVFLATNPPAIVPLRKPCNKSWHACC